MNFSDIVGHKNVIKQLKTAVHKNMLHNSYVFAGETGIGKKTAAGAFISAIMCESRTEADDSCGACPSCQKVNSNNHPDVITLVKDEKQKSIGVDTVREQIVEKVYIKPLLSDKKIFVISDGDLLTEQSQNALLKVLEEPPEYVMFIILASKKTNLLNTIRSRSCVINFLPLEYSEVYNYLKINRSLDGNELILFSNLSRGIIGRGLKLIDDESELLFSTFKNMQKLAKSDTAVAGFEKFLTENKESVDLLIDYMLIWLRDCLFIKTGLFDKIILKTMASSINDSCESISKKSLVRAMEHLLEYKDGINKNAGFTAITLSLLTNIREDFNDKGSGNTL